MIEYQVNVLSQILCIERSNSRNAASLNCIVVFWLARKIQTECSLACEIHTGNYIGECSSEPAKAWAVAKLYFNYSSMNAGKSTILLQASHNYRERGMETFLLTAALDDRVGLGKIGSRIGLSAEAETFSHGDDLLERVRIVHEKTPLSCVLVDEAQFLSKDQVWQLCRVADRLGVPVMCYGLRTDFQGELFPGSAALLALADALREIRTICWCGRKATMVVRLDADGRVIDEGDQVSIGGEESYVSLCRRHWEDRDIGPANQLKMFL